MLNYLKTYFGYDAFRPLQEDIIRTVLDKKDVVVIMPTGSGKSLCYQLPALMFDGLTIVVSPLIALMKDQVDALNAQGILAEYLNSTLSPGDAKDIQDSARFGELKILFIAPERLAMPEFREFLQDLKVSMIAIDEAHCISEWGHDFRPAYNDLTILRRLFPFAPVMALTATATPQVQEDIKRGLQMERASVYSSSFNRPNLFYSVRSKSNTFPQLVELLKSKGNESAIIYCFSRKDTESLAQNLSSAGFKALPYHAGLNREVRSRTQEKFIRDEVPIIIATIAFGMGINKPNVRLVVHMDLPKSIEAYYQETGRAGRDGLPSECVLFYSYGDKRKHQFFIEKTADVRERELLNDKLNSVVTYCERHECRRDFLIEYFGESSDEVACDACDNCTADEGEPEDVTETAQKILSAVLRLEERFGAGYVVDVLLGSRKKRIKENGHDELSVHGISKGTSSEALRQYVDLLLRKGYLEKDTGEYPVLKVSQFGRTALAKRSSILLPKLVHIPIRVASKQELEFDEALFEELRQLRKAVADERNVPAFVIFGDKTLQEMAYYAPRSIERLGQVSGVGKTKLEEFGKMFLECITKYAETHGIEEREIVNVRRRTTSTKRSGSTYQLTKELLEQKFSIKQIAAERGLSPNTIAQHVFKLKDEDDSIDITHLKPAEDRLENIRQAFAETGSTFLTPAKEKLGEDYSYEEIRLAKLFLSS